MSISIHELLWQRESEGVKAVKGDAMLCEKRLRPSARYGGVFFCWNRRTVRKQGEYHRCFLTKGIVPRADRGAKCRSFALSEAGSCAGRNTSYLPAQTGCQGRE